MMTLAPVFSSVSSVICLPFTYTTALSMGSKVTFPVKSQSHYVTFFQQGKKKSSKAPQNDIHMYVHEYYTAIEIKKFN